MLNNLPIFSASALSLVGWLVIFAVKGFWALRDNTICMDLCVVITVAMVMLLRDFGLCGIIFMTVRVYYFIISPSLLTGSLLVSNIKRNKLLSNPLSHKSHVSCRQKCSIFSPGVDPTRNLYSAQGNNCWLGPHLLFPRCVQNSANIELHSGNFLVYMTLASVEFRYDFCGCDT